jgi:hypothetical protein
MRACLQPGTAAQTLACLQPLKRLLKARDAEVREKKREEREAAKTAKAKEKAKAAAAHQTGLA